MIFDERAFTYPIFNGNHIDYSYLPTVADTLLSEGANTVQIAPFLTQATSTSSDVITSSAPITTAFLTPPSNAELQPVVSAFTAAGLNVELKVSLQPMDNSWSGAIAPTNVAQWFSEYTAAVVNYAEFAQENGISKLLIANELQSMTTNPEYTSYWNNLIDAVRAVYSGEIGINATAPYEATHLTFGTALDFIGVSLYPTLTKDIEPSLSELSGDWIDDANGNNWISILNQIHTQYGKPVEVSETAFESRLGAASQANYTIDSGSVDNLAQVNEYQSFFDVFSELPSWFLGVSFWQSVESSPQSLMTLNDPYDQGPTGPTVVGKPAESVVAAWFGGGDYIQPLSDAITGSSNNDQIYLFGYSGAKGTVLSQPQTFATTIAFTVDGTIINGATPALDIHVNGTDFGGQVLPYAISTYVDPKGVTWTQLQTFEVTMTGLTSINQLEVAFDSAVNVGGPENSAAYISAISVNGVPLTNATYYPLSGPALQQTIGTTGTASLWDGGDTIVDATPWNGVLAGRQIGTTADPIEVDGGGGVDTVHVLGVPSDYEIAEPAPGTVTLTENAGLDQNAVLTDGVRYISFSDGAIYDIASETYLNFIAVAAGPQTVIGVLGDVIIGGSGPDLISGAAGAMSITGGSGATIVYGGAGDTIAGGSGTAVIVSPGNEAIAGGRGATTVWGGAGDTITGSTGSGSAIIIGAANSTITAGSGTDLISGAAGKESITGGTGSATIWGGAGDTISGGAGLDPAVIVSPGNESIGGGSGATTVWGGSGDTITGSTGSGSAIIIGAANSTITAGSGTDLIGGGAGPMSITGGSGAATVYGGAGDTIAGGSGTAVIVSGGKERLAEGSGSTTIWGGADDTITGSTGSGSAIIIGAANSTITGGSGTDLIGATAGSVLIIGGSGTTAVWGGPGDTIAAGSGNLYVNINHASFSGAVLVGDDGVKGNDTVTGFSQSAGDRIGFPNETTAAIDSVVATAQTSNGNTLITLPDGATMTLIGITKIDSTFFA